MSETRNRFRAWLEHERDLGAYTFVSEHNMYQAYKEATYAERERGQAEVARLRGALLPLLDEIDTGGDLDYHLRTEGHAERLKAAFSTPADVKGMED